MENQNLQEQYALLAKEEKENKRKTIIIIILCILIILITLLGLYFSYSTINKKPDGGVCSVNCKSKGSDGKEYIINIDYNGDGKPRFNLDTDGDGIPDTNLINQDTDNDGKCDLNCDTNGDGKPDWNIDFDNSGFCTLNCGDVDTKVCEYNCDTDGDGKADTNVDTDGDKKPDFNVVDKNGVCILNCGSALDKVCKYNCDTNGDGKADTNVDTDGDKKPDFNVVDENGSCILNCGSITDKVCKYNCDTDNDGTCDNNCYGSLYMNADLKSLKIGKYAISPKFDANTLEYSVKVGKDVDKVIVEAKTLNPKAKLTGAGEVNLIAGNNRVTLTVVAEDGTVKTYVVNIIRAGNPSIVDNGNGSIDIGTASNGVLTVTYTKDINIQNILPGWSGTQTFTIKNTSNKTIIYNVNLIDVQNTFKNNEFKYNLVKDGNVIVRTTDALVSNAAIAKQLVIAAGETANFEINYEFVDINNPQDYNQGVNYKAKVEIELVSVN